MPPGTHIDRASGAEPQRRRGLLRAIERIRPGEDLHALRQVLVGPEQARLERTEDAASPAALARVLPEATVRATDLRGDEMATALSKPLTRALRDVAQREPELFGEILAPTIGTAVRTAVKEVISAVLARVNQLLERAVSVRSLRWRLEARRTGKSLAEIALAHTVLYRVEWVVVLHTETSLVLEQASLEEVAARVPDQLSAMLQAISSFVSDAFRADTPGGQLDTLEVGDLAIWLERDPAFTVAAAIRGAAPLELREQLRTTLAEIRTLHSEDLAMPVVETSRFADTQPLLAECLQQQLRPMPKRAQWLVAIVAFVALLFVAIIVARAVMAGHTRGAVARQDAIVRAGYEEALAATPGIFVTSIDRVGGLYRIHGLRDPRAARPLPLLARAGLPPPVLQLAPYDSADPRLGGPYAAFGGAIGALEQIDVRYPNNVAGIDPGDPDIRRAAQLIAVAQRAAAQAHAGLCIEVFGDASATGAAALNQQLRLARAKNVIDALAGAGVPRDILEAQVDDLQRSVVHERRVSFRGVLRPDPRLQGCRA